MTTGYLWTGQFEECQRVIDKGNNQSMELDEQSLDGHWSTNSKTGMDFFIINDAIFSKLCILGEDVEPCFEGASVTAPQVSTSFSKVDNDFKQTLFTMMQDLKFALEGGKNMEMENNEVIEETAIETEVENTEVAAEEEVTEEVSIDTESTDAEEESVEEEATEEAAAEFTEEENSEDEANEEESEGGEEEEETPSEDVIEEAVENVESDVEENPTEEFSLEDYNNLKASYSELESKYNELVNFKNEVENEKKLNLINSFYMLNDEDKKDVKEHMNEYSLDEIEAKLSVICVRNKVNFDSEDKAKNENTVEEENSSIATYTVNNNGEAIPAWISACINTQNSKK